MSKRKRRSSKRRKKRKSDSGFGSSTSKQGKSSFVALVAGMTTTLVLGMWAYSVFFLEPVVVPKKVTPNSSTAVLATSKFDVFLKMATPEQLIGRMTEQRSEIKRATNPTSRVYLLQQQIQVAERIIESETSRKVKDFATRTLLRNRKSLYGLHALGKIPSQSSSDNFKVCFEKYINDTNREIYREAHVCKLTYLLFEVIGGRTESSVFTNFLDETLQRFPNDEVVLGSVRQQFDACIENDIETAKRLGEELLRSAPGKDDPAADLYLYFLNRYYLIKANYKDLYLNRYANGKTGQRELEKQSIELLEHTDCGQLVVEDVNKVASWFESLRDPKPARNIYQTMIESGGRRSGDRIGEMLKGLGGAGISRLGLIGKPLSLEGVEHMGKPIDQQLFSNRVVMILFYSADAEFRSTKYLSTFIRVSNQYADNLAPVKPILVPVEPITKEYEAELREKEANLNVTVCNWKGSRQPRLLQRFPVTKVPYLIMLNHEGVVSSINVPIDEFVQEAGLLMDKR